MSALIGIVVLLVIVGAAVWLGARTDETGGNGDNRDAAARYGAGGHGL